MQYRAMYRLVHGIHHAHYGSQADELWLVNRRDHLVYRSDCIVWQAAAATFSRRDPFQILCGQNRQMQGRTAIWWEGSSSR